VLRSTTQLVQVNVIALDKEGRPVADLTANDFTLTDDGNAERISVFSVEKSGPASGQPRALPPNEFSNRWEDRQGAPASVTLILLDAVNTAWSDQAYARDQLLQFLKQMQPNDRIAIYSMGRSLRMLHDFSNDAASLSHSVAGYRGEVPAFLDLPVGSGAHMPQQERQFFVLRRAEQTVATIEAIAGYLARFPGRKNLIWISSAFPISLGLYSLRSGPNAANAGPTDLSGEIERAARALNNANLAIYPVDARGLMTGSTFSANRRAIHRTSGGRGFGESEIATMQELADRTGGRAFYNTNGIADAVQRALDDARVSYVLAYYPTHGEWDGKFHKITVRVARPGIQLHYRLGYFALPLEAPKDADRKAALDAAALSSLDATSLGLTAYVAPAGRSLNIKLQVDSGTITLQPQGDRWVGNLEFLFVQIGSDGHILKGVSETLQMNLKQDKYDQVHRDGLSLNYPLEVLSGTERIRIVVRDSPSGAMGSLSIPVSN
jgi:VWFA-related protein